MTCTMCVAQVLLLCLLLIAKGWCITRHTLQRREVCISGAVLALLYAAVSARPRTWRTPTPCAPHAVHR